MIKKSVFYSVVILMLVIIESTVFSQDNQKSNSTSMKTQPIPLSSFKHNDVGNPAIAGTDKISENGINITAGGADVWGVKDEFNFVYVERTGDFDLVSRIENLSPANLYTKAGLMAREDLTAGCRHIYFQVFPDNSPRNKNNGGYEFQYRQMKDNEMKAIYPKSATGTPEFPVAYPNTWIRLQRVKNDFSGYFSADGKTWKVYTTFNLDLPSKIYLGLAVTSHNVKETTAARFSSISEIKN
jgi:hypothetical protein